MFLISLLAIPVCTAPQSSMLDPSVVVVCCLWNSLPPPAGVHREKKNENVINCPTIELAESSKFFHHHHHHLTSSPLFFLSVAQIKSPHRRSSSSSSLKNISARERAAAEEKFKWAKQVAKWFFYVELQRLKPSSDETIESVGYQVFQFSPFVSHF